MKFSSFTPHYRRIAGVATVITLAAGIGASILWTTPSGEAAPSRSRSANPPAISGTGLEASLLRIFSEIEQNQTDAALEQTEELLKQYPNFRLGHLIKGDLLLARIQPINSFGNVANAPAERLADLRAEAIARLKAYRDKPSPDLIPRYLLQLRPDQKFAIVVDAQKSRLYLYQNDTSANGRPRLVADYYITQGKLGADKVKEGDKKTPIGVYHVTSSLPRQKVGDFYGSGAFPLSYPNEWDRRNGRSGHGIWLHGTPSDTFSRPPRASDGCVVLANPDLDAIARDLQIGLTPVIISNSVEWLAVDDWNKERTALKQEVDAWRSDWETRDINRFLSHYSKNFQYNGQGFNDFAEQKKQVNASKEWIKVALSNVSIFRNPSKEDMMVVDFEQDYRSNNLSNQMKKRQYWIREDGTWKIIYEGAA